MLHNLLKLFSPQNENFPAASQTALNRFRHVQEINEKVGRNQVCVFDIGGGYPVSFLLQY
jgi:hypothetical protein